MKITKSNKGNAVTLEVEGRLETGTAPELEVEINKALKETSELIIDFAKVEYVSSAGLRVLLTAQKAINAKNGKMKIVRTNDIVREVFDITGFTSILTIE